ncbi:hypothetical protein [Sphingopyxis sp. LK2115]|jgi:hypothetical protein|nr:hypothetical protein [Sphingopyxis sp. LK2115]
MSDMSRDAPPSRRRSVAGFDYFWSQTRAIAPNGTAKRCAPG